MSSIYLSGASIDPGHLPPVQGSHTSGPQADWRTVAMTRLINHGLTVVNPLEFAWSDFDYSEALEITDSSDQRIRRALDLIDQCDGLLANLERSNYGTAMEMFYAHRLGKMVTVVGPAPFNPWVLTHSQARFSDLDRAIRYIIGTQPQSAPVDFAIQFEAKLAERYEQMPPYGEADYRFTGGDIPVLLVAPHATAFWREGEFQEQESFTGGMAQLISRITDCHTLVSNYCMVADPCFYLDTPFKTALADIVRTGQIGMVLILMGATWQEAPGVQLSSYRGESNPVNSGSYDFDERLRQSLCKLEHVMPEFENPVHPLANFIAQELGTPCAVVRLSKRYRMPRLQSLLFTQAADALAAFVSEAGQELSRR